MNQTVVQSRQGSVSPLDPATCKRTLMEVRVPKLVDITGQRFGRLVALHRGQNKTQTYGRERVTWLCRCDCGSMVEIQTQLLRRKIDPTRSCGCATTDGGRKQTVARPDRLRSIWGNMITRCSCPSKENFERYGGRGITVCAEWGTFSAFETWALANGYAGHLTIDRIDNDGNYEPNNCRWATYSEQLFNGRWRRN